MESTYFLNNSKNILNRHCAMQIRKLHWVFLLLRLAEANSNANYPNLYPFAKLTI